METSNYKNILRELLDIARTGNIQQLSVEYVASLLSAYGREVPDEECKSARMSQAIRFIARQRVPEHVRAVAEVYEMGLISGEITGSRAVPFVKAALAASSLDDEELRQLVAVHAAIGEAEPGHNDVGEELNARVAKPRQTATQAPLQSHGSTNDTSSGLRKRVEGTSFQASRSGPYGVARVTTRTAICLLITRPRSRSR